MLACRAAQEASMPHSEYIDRKKENASMKSYPIGAKFATVVLAR